jgi:thymidylate synthase (FAD)
LTSVINAITIFFYKKKEREEDCSSLFLVLRPAGSRDERFFVIPVLDNGYIRTVNVLGSDIDVANAARVSFDKEVESLEEKDLSLISFLVKNKHDSCLRHCAMTFEVYAPLMVSRQWWKHTVSSTFIDDQNGWNESSRRYITENEQFYVPATDAWRSVPENRKQGSAEPVKGYIGAKYTSKMMRLVEQQERLYKEALSDGIAPEQARLLLPAYAMYVRWRWTASLNALLHFVSLRVDEHAQWEIQQYAQAINSEVIEHFPITAKAWNEFRI